jgi:hypothetical protein
MRVNLVISEEDADVHYNELCGIPRVGDNLRVLIDPKTARFNPKVKNGVYVVENVSWNWWCIQHDSSNDSVVVVITIKFIRGGL